MSLRKIMLSLLVAVVMLIASYLIGNMAIPLAGEKSMLQRFDKWKSILGINRDSVPDDVLLVNLCYDKALVDMYEEGMPVGKITVTDRQHLLDFLTIAKRANNYKFIMLDVIFEQGIDSELDSALFATITSMDRIVIPVHEDAPLNDSSLYAKAANADYTITWKETSFSRYQFLHDTIPSMPLVIYQQMTGDGIRQNGLLYFSHGRLCYNGVTLKLPVKISGQYIDKDNVRERTYLYLGSDLLAVDSIMPIADQIKDKIVVCGDFNNDVHVTYAGMQPGSVICLDAFYSLMRGDHYVNWLYQLAVFIIYFLVALMVHNRLSAASFFKQQWAKVLAVFITFSFIFMVVSTVIYLVSDIVFNPVLPSTVYFFYSIFVNFVTSFKRQ